MSELLAALPALGVGGILAAFIFWTFNKRTREHEARLEELLTDEKSRNDTLISLVKENTTATVVHTQVARETGELMRSLHRRLDDGRNPTARA